MPSQQRLVSTMLCFSALRSCRGLVSHRPGHRLAARSGARLGVASRALHAQAPVSREGDSYGGEGITISLVQTSGDDDAADDDGATIVWCHGLGDTAHGWYQQLGQ